ncbi:MAG: flagellar basal body rod protein FlgC [Alphaproteobacteria bacterium]|nr:flagellar basal body rod protein FlgC [Alphaproteobacteria bacterium]
MSAFGNSPILFNNSPLMKALQTSASAMKVQMSRLEVVAQNLANAHTTGTNAKENPYTRKTISFKSDVDRRTGVHRVSVKKIGVDSTPFGEEYDPGHPAADENGMIKLPNVNRHIELKDMNEAMRAHHVNMSMIKIIREMFEKTIGIMSKT